MDAPSPADLAAARAAVKAHRAAYPSLNPRTTRAQMTELYRLERELVRVESAYFARRVAA